MEDIIDTIEEKCSHSKHSSEFQLARNSVTADYMKQIWHILKTTVNTIGGVLITSYLLSAHICVLREDVGRAHLMSTLFIGTGLSSLLVYLLSSKYMVVGSVRFGYLLCSLSLLQQSDWKCPGEGDLFSMGPEARTEQWKIRLKELQGTMLCISAIHIAIGLIGGRLPYIIKPVNVAPTLILIGLAVTKTVTMNMITSGCWMLFTITVIVIAILYYLIECTKLDTYENTLGCSCWDPRITTKLYPAVIGCGLVWGCCALFSEIGLLHFNIAARTDVFTGIFEYVEHVRLPSLLQWGMPTFRLRSIILMTPALLASMYEAVAHRSKQVGELGSSRKRTKLVGSNITLEGICCFVSSIVGAGIGMNIGTKLSYASRSYIILKKIIDISGSVLLILIAFWGTLCACLSIIPEPIVAALIFVTFGSITVEGISIIRYVEFDRRNIYILGISVFLGIVIPVITEGVFTNEIAKSLMSTGFFITGMVSIFLDLIFPGGEVRNIISASNSEINEDKKNDQSSVNRKAVDVCECFCSCFA